jgi:hypothetical protein
MLCPRFVYVFDLTRRGPSFTKRLALFLSKSAAGGWCLPWANAWGKKEAKRIMAAKNATTIKTRQGIFVLNSRQFFRNQNCSRAYIGYFC